MPIAPSPAASLSPDIRKDIGIQTLPQSETITQIAREFQVSRKFVYQQGHIAQQALDNSFAPDKDEHEVTTWKVIWADSELFPPQNSS